MKQTYSIALDGVNSTIFDSVLLDDTDFGFCFVFNFTHFVQLHFKLDPTLVCVKLFTLPYIIYLLSRCLNELDGLFCIT